MKRSCIQSPPKTRYIQLFDWQVEFCQGNHCAALLLAFFISWHDWKLLNDSYYRQVNDIAEINGDDHPTNQAAYLFFSAEDLIEGCMKLYGKKAMVNGLAVLAQLGVISIHKNPNSRYQFDKTKYFRFYPHICNDWITTQYALEDEDQVEEIQHQHLDYADEVEIDYRKSRTAKRSDQNIFPSDQNTFPSDQNAFPSDQNTFPSDQTTFPSGENTLPTSQSNRAITDTTNYTTNHTTNHATNHTTNKYQSINKNISENYFNPEKRPPKRGIKKDAALEPILNSLLAKGMAQKKFYPDTIAELSRLQQQGLTAAMCMEAYELAERITHGSGFGMKYLLRVIEDLLSKSDAHLTLPPDSSKFIFQNDYRGGMDWMGDLI